MKKITLFLIAAAICTSSLQSCKKTKDLVKANVDINTTELTFDIPAISTTAAGTAMGSFTAAVNVDSAIKAANSELGAGNITNAKIVSMSITITNNDVDNNFSNLESCSASLSSNTKTDMITIASVTSNPDVPASYLSLNPNTDVELKDYFNATSFNYSLSGKMRRTTSHVLHAKATIKYTLTVSL